MDKALRVLVLVTTFWSFVIFGFWEFFVLCPCRLQSWWIQMALVWAPVVPVFVWLDRSKNSLVLLLRFVVSMGGLYFIHLLFFEWIHSPSFPEWLLTSGFKIYKNK